MKTIKSIANPKNIITLIPPFFKILKLAVNPTLAKNIVINKFCNVVSKVIVAKLVNFNINVKAEINTYLSWNKIKEKVICI